MENTKKEDFIKEYNELVAKYKLQVIPNLTLVVTEVPEVKEVKEEVEEDGIKNPPEETIEDKNGN